jgi:hypothetical protein
MNSKNYFEEKKNLEEICRLSNFIPHKLSKHEKKIFFGSFETLWSFHEKIFKKLETFQK